MAASYPSNLKSFGTKTDFVDTVIADHVNSLQEETVAVQTVLGTSPATSSGWVGTFDSTTTTWSNVKTRINNIEYGVKNVYDKVGGSNILPVANGGTGVSSLGTGIATFLGTPSSSNLAAAVTDETGSGALVFGTSPTIGTPTITSPTLTLSSTSSTTAGRVAWDNTNFQFDVGDGSTVRTITADNAAATLTNKTINGSNNTITNISLSTAVTGTLPVANGGTGITSFGTGIATFLGTPSSANLASAITDETGTGSLVFGTGPTITPAAGTVSTATDGAGYMGMPQNSQSTTYTLAATDAGKHVYVTSSTTITIPANTVTAFPVGTTIVVVSANGVSTTISINTDTLRLANSTSTGSRTLASNGMCTLLKIASTTWIASGNGLT